MLIVTGTIAVPPSDLSRFVAEMEDLSVVARQRDGNLSYDTAVLDAATGQLLVAERWRDEAALAAHLRAEETVAFVSRWGKRMQGDVRKYDAGDGRPLSHGADQTMVSAPSFRDAMHQVDTPLRARLIIRSLQGAVSCA